MSELHDADLAACDEARGGYRDLAKRRGVELEELRSDLAAAREALAKAEQHLLAEEERRKLTGDALFAEGEAQDLRADLARVTRERDERTTLLDRAALLRDAYESVARESINTCRRLMRAVMPLHVGEFPEVAAWEARIAAVERDEVASPDGEDTCTTDSFGVPVCAYDLTGCREDACETCPFLPDDERDETKGGV